MSTPEQTAAALAAQAVQAGEAGDLATAEQLLRRACALVPSVSAVARLALVLHKSGQHAAAVPVFAALLPHVEFNPDLLEAYSFSLEQSGALEQALAVQDQVLATAPSGEHALRWLAARLRQQRFEGLPEQIEQLLARFPEEHRLVAAAAEFSLGTGDCVRGFSLLRRSTALAGPGAADPRLAPYPVWDGIRFAGTLLVATEPHLGEEILFSSLLVELVRIGQPARVEVDVRMLPLYRRSFPSLQFVSRAGHALTAGLPADQQVRHALALDLAERYVGARTGPGRPAWLHADPQRVAAKRAEYQARWPGKKRIGISWHSVRRYKDADLKSIPLAALRQTLGMPDTVFLSLQYGDPQADLEAFAATGLPVPWRDPAVDATNDLDGLAAQLGALDAVVTVSNSTAHLAGALGVPTTVLLPQRFPVYWHWGYAGGQTPWYGSVRLLRNPEARGFGQLDVALRHSLQELRK